MSEIDASIRTDTPEQEASYRSLIIRKSSNSHVLLEENGASSVMKTLSHNRVTAFRAMIKVNDVDQALVDAVVDEFGDISGID